MKNEDLIDTAPVIMDDKTSVVFESLRLGINERGEIILAPDKPLRCPTLFMSDRGSDTASTSWNRIAAAITRWWSRPRR